MAEYGDGAFRSGERLTADKLNSLAAGRPLSVTGAGHADRGSGGDVVAIDQAEVIYIRLTGKDTTKTPIRYAWKEVARNGASSLPGDPTWQNINYRVGSSNGDYATELNNANLTVNDNYIYRSERSPTTGEWLFFLSRRVRVACGETGYCLRLPTVMNYNTASCSISTANAPYLVYPPGHIEYDSNLCKKAEYPNGYWTKSGVNPSVADQNYLHLIDYLTCQALYNNTPANLTKDSITRTEHDITSLVSVFFPSPIIVKSYAGPIDPINDCPALSSNATYTFTINKAVTWIDANLTAASFCGGFNVAFQRGYYLNVNVHKTEPGGQTYDVNLDYAPQGTPNANGIWPAYNNVLQDIVEGNLENNPSGGGAVASGGSCDATGPNPAIYGSIAFSY
ncbi:hypothetical protein UFOVP1622_4 [uncultured Caudovirales phage]|uniref:Uncharacterized protein n=1 Tax=uncultured Caudovirales phage TaxID=2100421 RepID=A0A6J5SXH6_9CAUD|nr:hypothetical protein UFOVP1021_40 [uncultured Caudovirales phage]CAB4219686.1 hypothetical protein UFOVP1622_4 [uncultured Caudovirales phage]